MNQIREDRAPQGTLGTFAGVFTPSIVTILGIILFLRLGFVVGTAGLGRALLIILLANAISVLTSVSLSAIATNLHVKGGGDYYLISRTLGVAYGGALGIVLFLAQSVSIAFYAIGFGEAVAAMSGYGLALLPQGIAVLAVLGVFVLAWLGADWATRFQYLVMAVLFAAILAFFVGGTLRWNVGLMASNVAPSSDLPFWVIFAVFFPAVTGFTQGVSMSGDLKDPGRSLPLGTFAAVGLSAAIYVAMAVVFAGVLPGEVLASDYGAMRRVSPFPWLAGAGVIAATLSSALASFLGAPRILQSLAADRVFPFLDFFARGHGPSNNPRRGIVLSLGVACCTIALGNLNVIAAVVSMFFLISYGLLNYATYFEARAKSPSFRPRFRFFNERLSLAGGLGCLGAMLAINPAAGVVAVAVLFGLHQYIARTSRVERWADSDRSRRLQRIREDLHAIASDPDHPRYWRPVVLAFSDDPERRERILSFASWLEGESGFTTAVRIVEAEGSLARRTHEEAEKELSAEIGKGGFPAFARVVVASDPESALPVILQAHGLGKIRANTVILNWLDRPLPSEATGLRTYGGWLRLGLRFGCNVIILAASAKGFASIERTPPAQRRIDVWHRDNATGRLNLLLAYLMTRTEEWKEAQIRLFVPTAKDASRKTTLEETARMLEEARIDAEPETVVEPDTDTVLRCSAGSSLVFLPFRLEEQRPTSVFGGSLEELLSGLRVSALVLAAQDIPLDSEPEEGDYAKIAEAVDTADKTRKAAKNAEADAAKAAETVEKDVRRAEAGEVSGMDEGDLSALESAARKAEQDLERARRRAAKARAKAEAAEEEVEELTGHPTNERDDEGTPGS